MKRTSINPWDWGLQFSMDQGEIAEGLTRTLHCTDVDGILANYDVYKLDPVMGPGLPAQEGP